jgi:hypothetical protein
MCSLTVLARHSAFSSGYLPTTPTILAGLLHAYKRGIAEPPALEQF